MLRVSVGAKTVNFRGRINREPRLRMVAKARPREQE
jgi:hypothetical protein